MIKINKTMSRTFTGIVLIGMPSAGKSTLGALLADTLSLDFIDTDRSIEKFLDRNLQDVIDEDGYMALRAAEEKVLLKETVTNKVIATGGSAVYSEKGMNYLKIEGLTVLLDLPQKILEDRITNFSTRGIARRPDQSFTCLFNERRALYLQHADIVVDCLDLSIDQVLERLIAISSEYLID
jgi:shikimate kinase